MVVHVVVAQRRHGVPKVVERCGGGAVVMLMRVLVETAAMMDAEGLVAAATARQAVVTFCMFISSGDSSRFPNGMERP